MSRSLLKKLLLVLVVLAVVPLTVFLSQNRQDIRQHAAEPVTTGFSGSSCAVAFTDVPANASYATAVGCLNQAYCVTQGYDAGNCSALGLSYPCFGATPAITRKFAIAFISRYHVEVKGDWAWQTPTGSVFSDIPQGYDLAREIETAAHYGFIKGNGNNFFPDDPWTFGFHGIWRDGSTDKTGTVHSADNYNGAYDFSVSTGTVLSRGEFLTQLYTYGMATGGLLRCIATPTPTTIPPTVSPTHIMPTNTPLPPTATSVPPTATPTVKPTGVPPITPTFTPSPTPNAGTRISLTVLLHGIGSAGDNQNPTDSSTSNKTPIHTTQTASVQISDSSNKIILTQSGIVTYADGVYKGIVTLPTSFTTGEYLVRVKIDKYLRRLVPTIQTITKDQLTTIAPITLAVGDINNDNQIDIQDYNLLLNCFSEFAKSPNCTATQKSAANLNDDNYATTETNPDGFPDKVNQADYALFIRELTNQPGVQ